MKVRWKAVTSELSYPFHQYKLQSNTSNTYISELDLSKLSQGVDNLAADFVGNVQLDHAHVRGPEHGILVVHHGEEEGVGPGPLAMVDDSLTSFVLGCEMVEGRRR